MVSGRKGDTIVLRESTEESNPRASDGPLFVVGVPRSGTSLLHVLLNQHPQIALMFEADLPLLWPLFLRRRSKLKWLERWNLWNMSVERHQIDISKIHEDIADVATATEATYREYAGHKSASIWGDKTPDQYDSLVRLTDYFPNARFIIIWRDPADVSRSMIRARKGSFRFRQQGVTHRALLGCQQLGVQRDRLLQHGTRVHELQYEDLVHNPADVMQKVCNFLGIPFHARMATLQNADRSAVHSAKHNALVNGERIVASRKYEEVLSLKLRRKIERYKHAWQQRGPGWAMFPLSEEGNPGTPSALERAVDQLRYRLFRVWDLAVVFAYCFAPLRLLTAYRAWKGHPYLNLRWPEYVRRWVERNDSAEALASLPSSPTEVEMSVNLPN
jgi:protein-tyrosine sulfotransferase